MNKNTEWARKRVKAWDVWYKHDGVEKHYIELAPGPREAHNAAAKRLARLGGEVLIIGALEVEA